MDVEKQSRDLEPIRQAFALAFIKAIGSKSVEDCADLVLTYEDCNILEVDFGLSKRKYRKNLIKQSKNFLKDKKNFIDKQNARTVTAITPENFEKITTYEFQLEDGYDAGFIRTISMSMKIERRDGMCYQVGFQINNAVMINGKIKINNLHTVKMSTSYWEEITKENTPYPLVQDKAELRAIIKKHAEPYVDKEYMSVLRNLRDWYVHDGDLTLETYNDIKVGLIVTGNLTIKEPVAEITHELIVLGKTFVTSIFLDDTNNVLFLGGIEFEVGIFITYPSSYQIFNQPKGPLFYTLAEDFDIDDKRGVEHICARNAGVPNDITQFLMADYFYVEELDDDDYPEEPIRYELDYEAVLAAIRAGKSIFKG